MDAMKQKKAVKRPRKTREGVGKEDLPDKEIKEVIETVAGDPGFKVISALMRKELTDDGLAKATGLKAHVVRRILYDLYDMRLVNYRRTRDDGTGWYVYHWYIEPQRAKEYLRIHKKRMLDRLKERLEYERGTVFFRCPNNCPKIPMDVAMELNFLCPTCGEKLDYYDNTPVVKSLESKIKLLEQELAKEGVEH